MSGLNPFRLGTWNVLYAESWDLEIDQELPENDFRYMSSCTPHSILLKEQ